MFKDNFLLHVEAQRLRLEELGWIWVVKAILEDRSEHSPLLLLVITPKSAPVPLEAIYSHATM